MAESIVSCLAGHWEGAKQRGKQNEISNQNSERCEYDLYQAQPTFYVSSQQTGKTTRPEPKATL